LFNDVFGYGQIVVPEQGCPKMGQNEKHTMKEDLVDIEKEMAWIHD